MNDQSVKERIADTLLDYMSELDLDRLIEILLNNGFSRKELLENGFNVEDVDHIMLEK